MKQFLIGLMIVALLPLQSFAECYKWEEGIKRMNNGNYEYSVDCHLRVGETVRDLEIALTQNKSLYEAIDFKNFALKAADERAQLWMDTSHKLEARVESMESVYERNKWMYFGLGILAAGAAVYAAGQLK